MKSHVFFAPMPLNQKEENMCNVRKSIFLGLVLISIFALTSLVFAEAAKIKGDVAGLDRNAQTMLLSTSDGFVQLNLAGSVLKRNGMGILPEEFQVGERVIGTYDPSTMNAIEVNAKSGYVEGFITAIETGTKGIYDVTITGNKTKPITVQVNQNTAMAKNGKQIKVFDYKVGDFAKAFYLPKFMVALKLLGWEISSIDSEMASDVKGYLVKIEISNQQRGLIGRVTISAATGELVVMNVDARTEIQLNGTPVILKDLAIGDFVMARSRPSGDAMSIVATRKDQNLDVCTGYIVAIKVRGDFVPVFEIVVKTNEYAKFLRLSMSVGAEVWKDGKRAKGFELKVGDFATIIYDKTKMDIVKIEAWTATK
jgi:hypothetical protein